MSRLSTGKHRAERPRGGWARRASVGLVAAGLGTIGAGTAGIVTAHAAAAPGSNFGGVDITSTAAGVRMPFYSHAGEDVETESPLAESTLRTGGVGHAVTSVFWPGGTGAHGGDTLYLLGSPCIPPNPNGVIPVPVPCATHAPGLPDSAYQALNDPYKAEAQTGAGKPAATMTGPGTVMNASATATKVIASTTMDGSSVPNVGNQFGKTTTVTTVHVTGPNTAVVDARSVMHDVSLGGGVITISSIVSVAHATTNGTTAAGTGSTTVQGMKLAGTPVVVDNKGIHVATQQQGLPSLDAIDKALAQSGFQVFVAQPSRLVQGANVEIDAGNLVFQQNNDQYKGNANDTGNLIILGGATIQASSNLGYQYNPPPPPPVGSTPVPGAPAAGGPPPAVGSGPVTTGGGAAPPPAVAASPAPVLPPVLAAQKSSLPGGIPASWVALVLLGTGLLAAGFKRLPDRVLAAGGVTCTLGDQT